MGLRDVPKRAVVGGLPWLMSAAMGALMVAAMWAMGRVWWCKHRDPRWFVSETGSDHNSQHWFDWYSFSHVLHGVVFFWALWGLSRKWPAVKRWALPGAVLVEAAWEVLENSPMVIARYRQTASVDYTGDSIVNSVGDLAFCVAGFYLAKALGWKLSLAVFVVLEVVMLIFIRDNLTLNVVMLIYPFEAVRAWQMGG